MANVAVVDEYRDSVCVLPGQEKRVSHTHFPAVIGDHVLDDGLLIVLVTQATIRYNPLIRESRSFLQTGPEVAPSLHCFGNELVNSPSPLMMSLWHHMTSLRCTVSWAWSPGPESQRLASDCDLLPFLLSFLQRNFARVLNEIIKQWNKDDSWSSVIMNAPFKWNAWLRGGAQILLWCHW